MPDEFRLRITLATPASDLVFGGSGNSEALFGRAGNDTIYSYDSGTDRLTQNENIDFLFGDTFDNTLDEYIGLISLQAGNPFRILETGPPSFGEDIFVLGDESQPYYTANGGAVELFLTNFLGVNEYAIIYDFNPVQDTIRLNGTREDYLLVEIDGLQVEGLAQSFFGEAIFSLQNGIPDLITYVFSSPEVDLSLNDSYFQFVGSEQPEKPARRKVGQFGTIGTDLSLGAAADSEGNLYIAGFTSGSLQGGTPQGGVDAWVSKYNSKGKLLFTEQVGTPDGDQAFAVVTDPNGEFYYLSGTTSGSLFAAKSSDESDAWVAKYKSNGEFVWGRQIGASQLGGFATAGFGLDVDKDGNVYLSGLTIKVNERRDIFDFASQDDSYVVKYNSAGDQQWVTTIGPNTPLGGFFFDENYDVSVDKDGNSYLTGWTQALLRESDPGRPLLKYDAWLSKVNPLGGIEWVRQFGSIDNGLEVSWAVDNDSLGNIYVTGWTTGLLGEKENPQSGSYDVWLSKFTPLGDQVWAKQIGSTGDDSTYLADMVIDSQDNIFVTGHTNGQLGEGAQDETYNAYVAKFDTDGENEWVQQFGSETRLDYATGLTVDNKGKLYVTGFTDGSLGTDNSQVANAGVDGWVAQFNAGSGRLQRYRGNANDFDSIATPTAIPVLDISDTFVTDEALPDGDNIIRPSAGLSPNVNVISYGQISDNLAKVFSPDSQNSFATALVDGVTSGVAPFLSASDLSALRA